MPNRHPTGSAARTDRPRGAPGTPLRARAGRSGEASIGAIARTLLVNFWYAHPVGHAIEALRYCLGYHLADPSLQISVALNAATPVELGSCCAFVRNAYAVPYTDFLGRFGDADSALREVPRDWDFVVDDARSRDPAQLSFAGVRTYYQAAHRHFRAGVHHGTAGSEPPAYRPHGALRLQLPDELRARAAERLAGAGTRIALLPAGSSEPSRYPSAESWALVVRGLCDALPSPVLCLLGKLERDARTSTSMGAHELEQIAAAAPRCVSGVDLPLLEQLALAEACDVFVSPHTGFGSAVLAVGTPWLALSGGPWHEWFFNDVPFYSLIPDTGRYPAYTWDNSPPPLADDGGTPRTPSMTRRRIEEDVPELVEAAQLLVERRLSYDDALARYFPALLAAYGGDRAKIFSLDSIHERYI